MALTLGFGVTGNCREAGSMSPGHIYKHMFIYAYLLRKMVVSDLEV